MTLENLRKQLKKIDEELLALLNERLKVSKEIGLIKKEKGLKIRDKKQEKAKIEQLIGQNKGKLSPKTIQKIWKVIFKESKATQKSV